MRPSGRPTRSARRRRGGGHAAGAFAAAEAEGASRRARSGVSKINHDLRNMLAAAQLMSDRLGAVQDPTVQRLAPKLVQTLDRAIAFCRSTLSYGRADERPPRLEIVRPGNCSTRCGSRRSGRGSSRALGQPRAGGRCPRQRPRASLPHLRQSLPERRPGHESGSAARANPTASRSPTDATLAAMCSRSAIRAGRACRRAGAALRGLPWVSTTGGHRSRPRHRSRSRPLRSAGRSR